MIFKRQIEESELKFQSKLKKSLPKKSSAKWQN